MEDQRIKIAIVAFLAGAVLTFVVYPRQEQETVYKFETVTKTDTLFVDKLETVYIPKTKIKTEVLRDTILIDFKPQISLFKTTIPFNSLLKPSASVSYLDNKYLFQYQYQPMEKVHQIGVSKKLF
jgi:hypothetical protein